MAGIVAVRSTWAQHLESPSEIQEETHVSRTAGRIKLVFGETGLQHKMATDRPVHSQMGFKDTFVENRDRVVKRSSITAQL